MTFSTRLRPRPAARCPGRGVFRFASALRTASAATCGTLLALLVAAACGGGAGGAPDAPAAEADARFRSPDEILRAEIVERGANAHNAMQLLRRVRPTWLGTRGANSFTAPGASYPVVYVDNIRRPGGLSALFQIPLDEIRRMEFVGPADATTRWGTGHQAGVILVVTGR